MATHAVVNCSDWGAPSFHFSDVSRTPRFRNAFRASQDSIVKDLAPSFAFSCSGSSSSFMISSTLRGKVDSNFLAKSRSSLPNSRARQFP